MPRPCSARTAITPKLTAAIFRDGNLIALERSKVNVTSVTIWWRKYDGELAKRLHVLKVYFAAWSSALDLGLRKRMQP